jgi:hypothetical protein
MDLNERWEMKAEIIFPRAFPGAHFAVSISIGIRICALAVGLYTGIGIDILDPDERRGEGPEHFPAGVPLGALCSLHWHWHSRSQSRAHWHLASAFWV